MKNISQRRSHVRTSKSEDQLLTASELVNSSSEEKLLINSSCHTLLDTESCQTTAAAPQVSSESSSSRSVIGNDVRLPPRVIWKVILIYLYFIGELYSSKMHEFFYRVECYFVFSNPVMIQRSVQTYQHLAWSPAQSITTETVFLILVTFLHNHQVVLKPQSGVS